MSNISTLGFNGEYLDVALNDYHLGNGYRAYNSITMQFTSPDDISPFGHGGINPYMYCNGDPINNTDPTGHFIFSGLSNWLGASGSIIGLVNTIGTISSIGGYALPILGGLATLAGVGAIISDAFAQNAKDSHTQLILSRISTALSITSIALDAISGVAWGYSGARAIAKLGTEATHQDELPFELNTLKGRFLKSVGVNKYDSKIYRGVVKFSQRLTKPEQEFRSTLKNVRERLDIIVAARNRVNTGVYTSPFDLPAESRSLSGSSEYSLTTYLKMSASRGVPNPRIPNPSSSIPRPFAITDDDL